MILTKEVEVKPSGKTISYYKDKEYDAKYHESLFVKVEDLPKHSKIKIEVACDYCGKIKMIQYADYLRSIKLQNKYACNKCAHHKSEETNLRLYGCTNYSSTKECREKVLKTNIERYGVNSPSMLDSVKEKIKQTNLNTYDCEYTMQAESVKEKSRKSCLEKYGVEYVLQSTEVREKGAQTYFKHSSTECSCQQFYIYNLYRSHNANNEIELNYPISYYNADICFINEKLDVEYDGSGHDLNVKTGKTTKEEFDRKAFVRYNVIKYNGYKQMRIISMKDKLPSDGVLLQMLEHAKQYFSDYPNHSWIEFDIDNSSVRNAENKDGLFYDYGKLRKIKSVA